MQRRLIIFTRYPRPGQSKTRLIPALGAQAASDLQRAMTQHTLLVAKQACTQFSAELQIHYSDGSLPEMRDWLGDDATYVEQCKGTLGDKLAHAVHDSITRNVDQTLVIGTDCPGLTVEIIAQAFKALANHDIALGPAADGGYYLVGLRCEAPQIFEKIDWGTNLVMEQTVRAVMASGLTVTQLPVLTDVDRPEDLPAWEHIQKRTE